MLTTIRIYLHYGSIIEVKKKAKQETQNMLQQEAYRNNFHQKYIQSEYAPYFKGHENNNIYSKEFLVQLTTKKIISQSNQSTNQEINQPTEHITPSQQRNTLLKEKIKTIR